MTHVRSYILYKAAAGWPEVTTPQLSETMPSAGGQTLAPADKCARQNNGMHPVLLQDVNSINYCWWLYKSNLVKFLSASDLILAHLRDKNSLERVAMSDIEKTDKGFH